MASFVTIEKSYLETLMRRAECHGKPADFDASSDLRMVIISRGEYDDTARRCREYENLKQALYRGGIPDSSLKTLIQGHEYPESAETTTGNHVDSYSANDSLTPTPPPDRGVSRPSLRTPDNDGPSRGSGWQQQQPTCANKGEKGRMGSFSGHDSGDADDTSLPCEEKVHSPVSGEDHRPVRNQTNGVENHTVVLKGLPDRATHRDVVAAVKGGDLVDVFLRSRERTASITFADSNAAKEYLAYAKRRNVYVLGRPVDASWSERQFHFPAYMVSQLASGASRNLVIRGVHPNLTEARIREDMEHVHNLVIISVTYVQGNAYISTNSVQKASFARNCMKSRIPYNSMRIEYAPDECAEPLPKTVPIPRREAPQPVKKLNPTANRFQMLNLDSADDEDSDDNEEELTSCTSVAGGVTWSTSGIAV